MELIVVMIGKREGTHPFAVVVDLLAVGTVGRAELLRARLLRLHLGVEGLADVVLLEVVPPVLPHPVLRPEDGLAALVLAVEVLGVLHLAILEPAALALFKPEEVLLPDVLRDGLGKLHERNGVFLQFAGRERLCQGQPRIFCLPILLLCWLGQWRRGGA